MYVIYLYIISCHMYIHVYICPYTWNGLWHHSIRRETTMVIDVWPMVWLLQTNPLQNGDSTWGYPSFSLETFLGAEWGWINLPIFQVDRGSQTWTADKLPDISKVHLLGDILNLRVDHWGTSRTAAVPWSKQTRGMKHSS